MKTPRYFCEHCGSEVRGNARICPHCGRFFSSVKCPKCGYSGLADDFAAGCPGCGFAYKQTELEPPRPSIEYKGSLPIWTWLAALVLLAGVLVLLLRTAAR
ncbi:MAG: double zinc ribbon domain-containing protein [Rectinemataceae bacterium]